MLHTRCPWKPHSILSHHTCLDNQINKYEAHDSCTARLGSNTVKCPECCQDLHSRILGSGPGGRYGNKLLVLISHYIRHCAILTLFITQPSVKSTGWIHGMIVRKTFIDDNNYKVYWWQYTDKNNVPFSRTWRPTHILSVLDRDF